MADESPGGSVLYQRVAKDIRDQFTAKDLRAVRAVLETHFPEPMLGRIELQSAIEFRGTRVLHVELDFPREPFGENATFAVEMASESDGPWKLGQIMMRSEQTVPGLEDPISTIGEIEPDTVAELVKHVSRFWTKSGAGRMKIAGAATNALPPLRLLPESLQGKEADVVYAVHVSSLEPVKPYVHPGSESADFVIASASSDSVFSIWLKRDENDQLVTTDVYAAALPVSDINRLELLRSQLEQPRDPRETQQRMDAIRGAAPEIASMIETQEASMFLHGQMESFMMHFPEKQVSDRRRESGIVSCVRVAGTAAPWQCSYQITSASQSVPGQKSPIMLALDVDEGLVDEVAIALQTALANHPSIAQSAEGIEIGIISPDSDSWTALVRRGLESHSVSFRYDGELEIVAIESEK